MRPACPQFAMTSWPPHARPAEPSVPELTYAPPAPTPFPRLTRQSNPAAPLPPGQSGHWREERPSSAVARPRLVTGDHPGARPSCDVWTSMSAQGGPPVPLRADSEHAPGLALAGSWLAIPAVTAAGGELKHAPGRRKQLSGSAASGARFAARRAVSARACFPGRSGGSGDELRAPRRCDHGARVLIGPVLRSRASSAAGGSGRR